MITGKKFIDLMKQKMSEVIQIYRYPQQQFYCVSLGFGGLNDEEREEQFCQQLEISTEDYYKVISNCSFSVYFLSPEERKRLDESNRGTHWLGALAGTDRLLNQAVRPFPVVHFFGYKGGQGRSTVLACMANYLASNGYKVLAIDADLEAPSLDEVFGIAPIRIGSTLLGLFQGEAEIIPVAVRQYTKNGVTGTIELICSRLRDTQYDIDYAAFIHQSALSPMILEKIAGRIQDYVQKKEYDIVLIDHRSGMAVPTLTWLQALLGPTIVFARMDGQWRGAESVIKEVLSTNPPNPGLIVSFLPDEENEDVFRIRSEKQKNELLTILCDVVDSSIPSESEDDDPLAPEDLEDHWIVWSYDQVFRSQQLPEIKDWGTHTRNTINQLIQLLNVPPIKSRPAAFDPNGSVDKGDFILTEMYQHLLQPNNPYTYIFGRKGTGKTRILTELSQAGLGEALLVDEHCELETGLKTTLPEFKDIAEHFADRPELLWWSIFLAALRGMSVQKDVLLKNLQKIQSEPPESLRQSTLKLVESIPKEQRKTYLIDGIETAFESNRIFKYVESLFSFLRTIQTDPRFSERLEIKLFLRTDLAQNAVQNLEQLIEKHHLKLEWDYQRILNFALSRLKQETFQNNFPEVLKEIEKLDETIQRGEVLEIQCEEILLKIFPDKIKQFKVTMKTFFTLHFTDAIKSGTYYPRVMQSFLQQINSAGQQNIIEAGRIKQSIIVNAHEKAAKEYLGQVRQELMFLLNFEKPSTDSQILLDNWLNSFSGEKTPFSKKEMTEILVEKTELDTKIVSECLDRMKTIGIFEDRPGYPGQWRVGRLFKSSLKMKYNRRIAN